MDGPDREIDKAHYGDAPLGDDFLALGHESLGEVVKVGRNEKNLKTGDRIVTTVRRPDNCFNCKVDPRGTSQKCSCCGSVVKKDLSDRTHECPFCEFVCDRDYNASRNILILGMGLPLEPAEPEPLHHISVMQVLVMNQEAPPFRAG